MCYGIHPNEELRKLFKEKPYQGQDPKEAKIIFLNTDANYPEGLTADHNFFKYIKEYHKDGVSFWKEHKVHHPFLLDEYPFRTGGLKFHQNFRCLCLDSSYAENISFVELLDVPTYGNRSNNNNMNIFYELINEEHLKWIDNLVYSNSGKLIFASIKSDEAFEIMDNIRMDYGVFDWLDEVENNRNNYRGIKDIQEVKFKSNSIRIIYHFSADLIHAQIPHIRKIIDDWLKR